MGFGFVSGEAFKGVHGELLARFRLYTDRYPALGEVQGAVERRMTTGLEAQGIDERNVQLADWRGEWEVGATGRWKADVWIRDSSWVNVGEIVVDVHVSRALL
ncbi:MAG TPA: hypothetical protein VMR97_02315 [Acidimicrobiales bacterium]|nr:hypothetical protein [Acidimicrobiales bacterium]